jgi:ADP-glucose pyrophosphorylase
VIVKEGAIVREAVLWDECVVGKGAKVERCILGSRCEVEDNAAVEPDRAYGCSERITAGVAA